MASVGNILENPHIGLLFLDYAETRVGLHVNGRARALDARDIPALSNLPSLIVDAANRTGAYRAEAWIVIDVEEAYIHCSRHVPLMKRLDQHMERSTDEGMVKGRDFFRL